MSSKKIEPPYPSPFGKDVKHHEQPTSKDKEKDKDKKRKTLLRGKKKKKPTKLENVYSGSTGLVTSIKKREYSEEPSTFNISGHNFKCLIDENVKQKKCNFCRENFTTEAYICKNIPCGYEAHWNCLASQIPVCQASTHFQKQRTFTTTDDFRNSPKSARSATGPSAWGQFSQSDRFLVDDPNDHKQTEYEEGVQTNAECAFSLMLGIQETLKYSKLQIKSLKTRKKLLKQREDKVREQIKIIWEEISQLIEERQNYNQSEVLSNLMEEYEANVNILENCVNSLEQSEVTQLQTIYDITDIDKQQKYKFDMRQELNVSDPLNNSEFRNSNMLQSFNSDEFEIYYKKLTGREVNFSKSMHQLFEVLQTTLKLNDVIDKKIPSIKSSSIDENCFLSYLRQIQDKILELNQEELDIVKCNKELEFNMKECNLNMKKLLTQIKKSQGGIMKDEHLSAPNFSTNHEHHNKNLIKSSIIDESGQLNEDTIALTKEISKHSSYIPGKESLININPPDLPPISIEDVDSPTGTSIEDLIEIVVDTRVSNIFSFSLTFLRCYRYFMTTEQLITKLILRFCSTPPSAAKQLSVHREKQNSVRLRIIIFFKYWITACSEDFIDVHSPASQLLTNFLCKTAYKTGQCEVVKQLLRVLTKVQATYAKEQLQKQPTQSDLLINQIINSHPVFEEFSILQFTPEQFAKNLTRFEHDRFCLLKPGEFLCQRYTSSNHQILAPNITSLTTHCNQFIGWIWREILTPKDPEVRAEVLRKSILICLHLFELGNFAGCIEFIAALNGSCITRLRHTWCIAGQNLFQVKEDFGVLSQEKNYAVLRKEISLKNPPIVPFIGMYLADLTFFDEGNPNLIDGKINFGFKFNKISETVSSILRFQDFHYDFPNDPHFDCVISNLPTLSNDEAFKLSEAREPRAVISHLPRMKQVKFWIDSNGDDLSIEEQYNHLHNVCKNVLGDPSCINPVNFTFPPPGTGNDEISIGMSRRGTSKISARLKEFSNTIVKKTSLGDAYDPPTQ